jgi:hypothetical protein
VSRRLAARRSGASPGTARRLAILAFAAALLAGCGEKSEPAASRVTAVTGTLDLARPAPASPDSGTKIGRRAPDGTASTRRSSLAFAGRVAPATSRVTLRPEGGAPKTVAVARNGSFRARARKLERGANRFVLVARSAGLAPWQVDISITRK